MNVKPLLSSIMLSATVITITGCTTSSTNTNTVNATNVVTTENTNTTNDNTNTAVTNDNTNTEQGSEVDTSDWLTYQNDTLDLSFKYPKDWKLIRTQEGVDFTEVIDNNDIYDHQLVNLYIHWSDRHEGIVYESGIINPSLDRWLDCDYSYDLQSECTTISMDGIEVIRREGQIETPFGDDYVALVYKKNDFTVVIDARSLLRESTNNTSNNNLDGLDYINAIIETMSIN